MNHGLPEAAVSKICGVFERFPEIECAVLYGSRAKGTHRNGSDIDLTLEGDALDISCLGSIADALDDLLLPYKIDLSIRDAIKQEDLREHIERVGQVLYRRGDAAPCNMPTSTDT
jgi:uncharacterized protein